MHMTVKAQTYVIEWPRVRMIKSEAIISQFYFLIMTMRLNFVQQYIPN